MLQHDVLDVAFFPAPMPEKSSRFFGSLEGDLLHSPMPEILFHGARQGLPPGPDFYGMEECKMSHSRDRKTFRHLGMQKVSFQGPEEFSAMGNMNKIYGWQENCPGISSWIANPW
jgi:hypothetical protein